MNAQYVARTTRTLARFAPSALTLSLSMLATSECCQAQELVWASQFGDPSGEASHITPDGAGGAYTCSLDSNSDVWVTRHDQTGTLLWSREFTSSDYLYPASLATDATGGVFLAGSAQGNFGAPNQGGRDAFLIRLDSSGSTSWTLRIATSSDDWIFDVWPDGVGGATIRSTSGEPLFPSPGTPGTEFIGRVDGAGNLVSGQYVSLGLPSTGAVVHESAADGFGGFFLAGSVGSALFGPLQGVTDAWVAHYDGAGQLLWGRQFGSGTSVSAKGVAIDGDGGVLVGGQTHGALGGPSAGGSDLWIAHFDANGTLSWLEQMGTPQDDFAETLAPDGHGGAVLFANSPGNWGQPGNGGRDIVSVRVDRYGVALWTRVDGGSGNERVFDSRYDGLSGVLACGRTFGSFAGVGGAWMMRIDSGLGFDRICTPAVPNSTGRSARLDGQGSNVVARQQLEFTVVDLPQLSFGMLINSQVQGFSPNVGGGQGTLCLGGGLGRHQFDILNSGSAGMVQSTIDVTALPRPNGLTAIAPGETWLFQYWYRDVAPTTTSNMSDAIAVTFR